jgi:threonine dehydratase
MSSAVRAERPARAGAGPRGSASKQQALEGEEPSFGPFRIAEGIAIKKPGELTLRIVRQTVDEILLVADADIEAAVLLLLEMEKTVVEAAAAVVRVRLPVLSRRGPGMA